MKKQILLLEAFLSASIFSFAETEYSTPIKDKTASISTVEIDEQEEQVLSIYAATIISEKNVIISDTYNITNIGIDYFEDGDNPGSSLAVVLDDGKEYKVFQLGKEGNPSPFVAKKSIDQVTSITIGQYVKSIVGGAFVGFTALETFTCNATTPPTIAEGAMDKMPKAANLVVPIGTEETYWASDWGKYFTLINGEEKPSEGDATGISTTKAQKQIWLVGRIIKLAEEQEVRVYNIAGATIFSGYAAEVELPSSGIFVVKTATETAKFNCR